MRHARLQSEIILHTEDRVGVLAQITRLLGDMGINLLSVLVRTNEDEATIHLVTTSQTYALDALQSAGFRVDERDVVVVELPHRAGFLSRVAEALARKDIAVLELYATIADAASTGVVVFTCSNNSRAVQMLRGH